MKGKLIVIDGIDGSGKATQARLLVGRLKREGVTVRTLDFPQYENNFFGKFLGECLRGRYGDFLALDPRIASVLYSVDRFESKKKIVQWLKKGCVVVLDRYASSNQIHQGGKITDGRKRGEFLQWLDDMEYGVFGLPRPDLVLYLDVPVTVTLGLLADKDRDRAEENHTHLEQSRKTAQWLAKRYGWITIHCMKGQKLRSAEEIGEEIWGTLKMKN